MALQGKPCGVMVLMMGMMVLVGLGSSMNVVEVPGDTGGGVSLMWGISDTSTSVGRLFRYHIPGDAFKGPVELYQVEEAGKGVLPSWLRFTGGSQNVLEGVPSPADAGQLYLQVTAFGAGGASTSDVFSLTVNSDTPSLSAGQPLRFKTHSSSSSSGPAAETVRCQREEPETVATIVLDADLTDMAAERRLELFGAFLAHMGLAEGMVKMVPASGPLHDDSALVTGTGDVIGDPRKAGVTLSWLVGCGKVEPGHFPLLHRLDGDSSSGDMARALGTPVVGWRVTNSRLQQQQQQKALKRRRRQARATPTPVITISPPTATDDTMTRSVIAMSSPTFTIEPTPTHPDMPKTTTTTPSTTTPKMDKPDPVTSRKPDVKPPKTDPLPPTTPKMPPVMDCDRPTLGKTFQKKTFLVGEIIDFSIPEDLFDACGKGGTSHTKLTLFKLNEDTDKKRVPPKDFFVQLDQRRQVLRGMALSTDTGRHPLTLVAMLRDNDLITEFTFDLVIRAPKGRKANVNHKISVGVDADYKELMSSMDNKIDLASKVAGVFGDSNPSAITVEEITAGSVHFTFTNNTMSGKGCPADDITAVVDKLVTSDNQLTEEAKRKMEPWVMTSADVTPAGDCTGDSNFPVRSAVADPAPVPGSTQKPQPTPKPDMAKTTMKPGAEEKKNVTGVASAGAGGSGGGNMWVNTVVPAVVIVAILLVALLVACILYRKKRKGNMSLEDNNTFVNKGAPVIFPDELDDKPSDSTKPLLIEGSPPAAPPGYHHEDPNNANNKESTPPTDEVDAQIEIDATSPLYQPPPPVPANSGKQARPPHVQQPYRSQPPEIHP